MKVALVFCFLVLMTICDFKSQVMVMVLVMALVMVMVTKMVIVP